MQSLQKLLKEKISLPKTFLSGRILWSTVEAIATLLKSKKEYNMFKI